MSKAHRFTHFMSHHIPSSKTTFQIKLTHTATRLLHPTAAPTSSSGSEKNLILHQTNEEKVFQLPDEYALCKALKTPPIKHSYHEQRIHAFVIKLGFSKFTILMTALTDFKLKHGSIKEAQKVFNEMAHRDVVSWTSMIVGSAHQKHYIESLNTFRMLVDSGVSPNAYTFSGVLTACCGIQAIEQGRQIHAHVLTSGMLSGEIVLQNSLLHMYATCQEVIYARKLFDSMMVDGGNNISWNEMISGYVQCGDGEEGLELFVTMVSKGVKPDDFCYSICAEACASLASVQQGSQIHACIVKSGFYSDVSIRNSLVNMYAKCGCVESAETVFEGTSSKDTLLWTAMISAYGTNGRGKEVLDMFEKMRQFKIRLDEVVYLAVLSACSHGGFVDQGWFYFRLMTEESLIPAGLEHYACMVDLLCRGGHLLKALEFIEDMPFEPSISIWSTFLNSCRVYENPELAEYAAEQLFLLEPENPNYLVTLSNAYAVKHDWDETRGIRERMKSSNVKKEPGCSWVELKNGYHVFFTGETSHAKMVEIIFTLKGLMNSSRKDEC